MKVNSNNEGSLVVGADEAEELKGTTYLVINFTKDGVGAADIMKRIVLASSQFKRLSRI